MNHPRSLQPPMPVAAPPRRKVSIWPMVVLLEIIALLNLVASSQLTGTWWANFIFVPAVVLLASAWWLWPQTSGGLRMLAHMCLSLGAIVFSVAAILLLDVMWFGWALLLIVPSLALVGHSIALRRMTGAPALQAWLQAVGWSGAMASLLGVIFLLMGLNIVPMQQLVGSLQWWGGLILLAGAGTIWNAWWLYRRMQNRLTPPALLLGALGVLTCIQGLLELANIW